MNGCTVCSHPDAKLITEALAGGSSLRRLSEQYDVGRMALLRHARHSSIDKSKPKLTPRQARFIRELSKRPTDIKTAAIKAGYSPASAAHGISITESGEVQRLLRNAIQRNVSIDRLVERISEGLDATETKFFAKDGEVRDQRTVPAWGERRAYLELAVKLGGFYVEKQIQNPTVEVDLRPVEELIDEARRLSAELERIERAKQLGSGDTSTIIDTQPED